MEACTAVLSALRRGDDVFGGAPDAKVMVTKRVTDESGEVRVTMPDGQNACFEARPVFPHSPLMEPGQDVRINGGNFGGDRLLNLIVSPKQT
jgi:hypothetical protein